MLKFQKSGAFGNRGLSVGLELSEEPTLRNMKVSRRQFGLAAFISLALPRLRAIAIATDIHSPIVADIGQDVHLN
jgi:hypothetical protein